MIASSLCNYTILTAAGNMTPSGVMTMNIVINRCWCITWIVRELTLQKFSCARLIMNKMRYKSTVILLK